jgi:hypothetical protein
MTLNFFRVLSCMIGVVLISSSQFSHAQTKKKRFSPDTNYIHSYPQYLAVGMFVISPTVNLRLEEKDSSKLGNKTLSNYQANLSSIVGFSLGYGAVHFSWGFNVGTDREKNKDLVASKYNVINVRVKHPVLYMHFRYSRLQGLTDMNEQNSKSPLMRYVKRDDIRLREYSVEGIYNFSWRKYSYTAPLTFLQRQLKSRIGILAKAGVSYSELGADSALITTTQLVQNDKLTDIQRINGVSVKLAPGVGGNLVFFKRIYLSGALFVAYDLFFYDYKRISDGGTKSGTSFVVVLDGRFSLGYQSERLYAGLRYEVDRRGMQFDKTQMTTEYSYVGLEFGYRFNAPGFLKKGYAAIMPGRMKR